MNRARSLMRLDTLDRRQGPRNYVFERNEKGETNEMRILILSTLVIAAGCFNPHYDEGAFACGTSGTAALPTLCPSGQSCFGGRCYSHDPGDAGTGADRDANNRDVVQDVPAEGILWELGHVCNPQGVGTDARNLMSNCQPPLVCVNGNMFANCFMPCTQVGSNAECDRSNCETRPIDPGTPAVPLCGWQPQPCDPVAQTGCPVDYNCYLEGAVTICESSTGGIARGDACTYSRQCLPNLTCAGQTCRVPCNPGDSCSGGLGCRVEAGVAFGYCP